MAATRTDSWIVRWISGLLLALAGMSAVQATNWTVQAGGSQLAFYPQEITIAPGDTVTFRNLGGFHNVTADDGAFRCARGCDGQGGNGSPSSQIWVATVAFPNAGRFGYFCEPHGQPGKGMYGTIVVLGDPPIPIPINNGWFVVLLGGALLATTAALMRSRRHRSAS